MLLITIENTVPANVTKKSINKIRMSKSCGLAVKHSAHNRKVVGSIPFQSNARWKWCQSHARMIPTPNSGSIKKNKKIEVAKWGTPKNI